MTEKLLHYIWQMQYYNNTQLCTEQQEPVKIIFPGQYNTNQGPDFLEARIEIGNTIWAGNIELHLLTSDWDKHAHSSDKNYNNVILHVVWKNDLPPTQSPIPIVELEPRVSHFLLNTYENFMLNKGFVACENGIAAVNDLVWLNWKERLLVERLQQKSAYVLRQLSNANNHWEEVLWWMLARNFGLTVNAAAFEAMAQTISINILAKHKQQIHQLEALLLGQAGLLQDEFIDSYALMLQKEYRYLKHKLKLVPTNLLVQFLRMRPFAFPTVRLAQLAMLVHQSTHLFSIVLEEPELEVIKKRLLVTANDYWHYHFRFDDESKYAPKQMGNSMANNIIINTIVPVLFAYGLHHQLQVHKDKALKWLQQLTAEQNSITKSWQALQIENKTAFDSQALLQLKNNYCNQKRCLDCAIGNAILKRSSRGGLC